ncbi:GDP-mannose 4,6-dehydratase [Candidatus Daviesbacteria bacterium]|nr:GDP-mannose 4,6-dehydratase [Candidatus Daviesbacteria bacterium]
MVSKKALITGITGQDGSYLAEFLLEKGYEIAGFARSSSTGHLGNIEHLRAEIRFFRGSLDDERSIEAALSEFKPDEIYNLGAEAAPADSFKRRVYTSDINALGPLRVYEAALRLQKSGHQVKVYQASTSEMYGAPKVVPQDETTPFIPNNPYGVAKLFAHHNARIYREGTDKLWVACGILFNHESPRRGIQYVTRKVTVAVACIANKVKNPPLNEAGKPIVTKDWKLHMGNLEPKRDWGYAKEFIEAIYLIMQTDNPDDFVIATGETHTIREMVEVAFSHAGLNWQDHVVEVPAFMRPLETGPLCGNPAKAKQVLGWEAKIKFQELIKLMVDSDLAKFS